MEFETDVDTFLAGEADRLRVVAFALRLPRRCRALVREPYGHPDRTGVKFQ
ncbi:MAG: hypothetical protein HY716_08785 [Planctomycetes bacterium]|nr:hypothetical protein [Planctomycetota bacterium]